MLRMTAASPSELPARAPRAVLLVRDDGLRETVAAILSSLRRMVVTAAETIEAARHAVHEDRSAVLIVGPAWGDVAAAALLEELRDTALSLVIVSASREHASLASGEAVFVRAPFDVDTLLDAVEQARGAHRTSRVQRIAR